ncbi:MAG: DUF1549 and DUF1553 domain-containing protein [Verrucomicrobiaceae bacterium]|nr:DUF1549 and DUF1553 domain-containing protein [Verrucomicrobiaceae bacterium]
MKTSRTLLTSVCFAVLGVGALQAATAPASRMWTDTKGRQVEATFQGLDGDNIILQTKDGQPHRFPLANLSAEDQQFARKLAETTPAQPQAINASVAQAADKIDRIVAKGIVNKYNPERAKKGLPPLTSYNPLTSDEQFIRRVYLDIIGRIPNYDETMAFLDDKSPTKRAKVIDMLLDSQGYASHMYNYIADMLRVRDRFDGSQVRGTPYITWLKEQVAQNRPWNELVHEMLTADGKMWDNPATGYLLRDSGMPLDNLATTLTVFLGTDVACAQCHDHPFANWTQMQFYQLASFFGATTTRLQGKDFKNGDMAMAAMPEVEKMIEASGTDIQRVRNGLRQFINANRVAVENRSENTLKLPMDYKYKDAKGGDTVAPKFVMWSKADAANPAYKQNKKKEERLRDSFAGWLTHKENPRFAMTIANRLWKRAFGAGVAEPITNIDDPSKASNPELLVQLANEMKRLNFDLKAFMRLVYNTKCYQAEATTEPIAMGEPYYFQGPQLRRLTAEQAWDSYMTLVLSQPEKYKAPLQDLYEKSIDLNLNNPKLDAKTILMKFAAYQKMGEKMREYMGGSLDMAGDAMMMEAGKKGDAKAVAAASGKVINYGGMSMLRASELEQPARPGHFLTEFGQSQRLLADATSRNGSVPQVLMLMNGDAQAMLTNSTSPVLRSLEKAQDPQEKVDRLFLSVLNRHPSENEKAIAKKEIESSGTEAFPNMMWALINTREFIFMQ